MSYAQYDLLRKDALDGVLSVLPSELRRELLRLGGGRAVFSAGLSEIRARAGSVSVAVFSGVNLPIAVKLSKRDIEDTLTRIHKGALYMHKESLARGFITMENGVRVGIVGTYYEGLIGDATALIFRLPFFDFDIGARLRGLCEIGTRLRSMLVYSPPGVGKTTAIRSLALALAEDAKRRIVAIDERREFPACLCEGGTLDILYGYTKEMGIEVATRVLNPELIIVDELGNESEAKAVFHASMHGVPIVATAHAKDEAELMRRPSLEGIIKCRIFELAVGISRSGSEYRLSASEVGA